MANRNYSQPSGSQTYRRVYAGFRGVDFTNNPLNVDPSRSPYAENFITDGAGVVHKRPPYIREWGSAVEGDEVHSIFFFKPEDGDPAIPFVHVGRSLIMNYSASIGGAVFNDAPSVMFQHNNRLYILDGKTFRTVYYDDSSHGYICKNVSEIATAPETQIAGYYKADEYKDENDETAFEYEWVWGEEGERNLLTARRINTFCGDGVHKVFYLDSQNFKVYKVEMFSPSGGSTTDTDGTVTIRTGSNIRKAPSMSGAILANTGTSTPTCTTTGKTGSWYQIVYNGQTAYVHQDRVSAYTPPSSQSSTPSYSGTDVNDWVEITGGYTVSEVGASGEDVPDTDGSHVSNCTKITFTSAPPVHPRGAGLPNIRVTGAVTELSAVDLTLTAEMISEGEDEIAIPSAALMTEIVSVKVNGTAVSSSAYTVTTVGGTTYISLNSPTAGDKVEVAYRRESTKDIDLINGCDKYGKFGAYNTDRWFFTGNTERLNRDWHSEPSDPTLVLENSYTDVGDSSTGIAGYLNYQSDMLIIKYDSNTDNLFRRTASSSGDEALFPIRAYQGRGATSAHAIANVKGECVFLSPEGVYEFISSDLGSRYSTKEMSYLVKERLLKENLAEAEMGVWGDWLMLSFPTTHNCYVADTTQLSAPSSSGGYGWEWYYWTGYPAANYVYNNEDDRLYFSTAGGNVNYTARGLTDYQDYPNGISAAGVPYAIQWATPQDALDEPARYKVIEARGVMMRFEPFYQTLQVAVAIDGVAMISRKNDDVEKGYGLNVAYDFTEIHASPEAYELIPYRRLHRFKYIQFIFRNSDPTTDGIGLLMMEFQYRYARYIH